MLNVRHLFEIPSLAASSILTLFNHFNLFEFYIRLFRRNNQRGPVAQWITRLPTEQKIAGSIPAWIVSFLNEICKKKSNSLVVIPAYFFK
jgi:hypothetical protein